MQFARKNLTPIFLVIGLEAGWDTSKDNFLRDLRLDVEGISYDFISTAAGVLNRLIFYPFGAN